MSADHYVSKFHLGQFCDPDSLSTPDPWLWLGRISDRFVTRKAPKNVGKITNLFAGPGGLADRDATLEGFLAENVEGPAAKAIRHVLENGIGPDGPPPALFRYLAWAASRSRPMQKLGLELGRQLGRAASMEALEPPPPGLSEAAVLDRPVALVEPTSGKTIISEGERTEHLLDDGWIPDLTDTDNFLEGVHIQAYYFQVRWFPRLKWFTLRPPAGEFFVVGDRPVGWGLPDYLDAPPSCLRDPSAFLIAPISSSLALVGRNGVEGWSVTPRQINSILATWSHEWIAGPTQQVVATALHDRAN